MCVQLLTSLRQERTASVGPDDAGQPWQCKQRSTQGAWLGCPAVLSASVLLSSQVVRQV